MKVYTYFLFITIITLLVFSSLILTNSEVISRERYEKIKSKASFDVIDYEDYLANYAYKQQYAFTHSYEESLLSEEDDYDDYTNKNFKFLDGENIFQSYIESITIPYEFNWAKKVPECFTVPIKDQDSCGSCYAFSATFSLAKRMCLFDRKYTSLDLSPQDLISCDSQNNKCHGALLSKIWDYLEKDGVAAESCIPYSSYIDSDQIEHYPKCTKTCSNFDLSYTRYTAEKGTLKRINNDTSTRLEILLYGPVSTFMTAYDDLYLYGGGIYKPTSMIKGGGHAVSLIGWGYDSQSKSQYWIVANSWGANWGENGYFKIPFNSSEINKFSYASKPLGWNGRNLYNSVVTK